MTFWDVRPSTFVNNCDTTAADFKAKLKKYDMRYLDEGKCPGL